METTKPKLNSNGTRAVVVISILIAIVGSLAALVNPINTQLQYANDRIDKLELALERQMEKHESLDAHHGAQKQMGQMEVMFQEIETQFQGMAELRAILHDQNVKDIDELMRRVRILELNGR